jgi:hypothetical protein
MLPFMSLSLDPLIIVAAASRIRWTNLAGAPMSTYGTALFNQLNAL